MRFVIDGSSVDFTALVDHERYIDEFLDLIDEALSLGYPVCFDEELFNRPLIGTCTLWELFNDDAPVKLTAQLSERLAALFGAIPRWDALETPWPESFEVTLDGSAPFESPSIAWTHRQSAGAGIDSPACLCAKGSRPDGKVNVSVSGETREVWLIAEQSDIEKFFRWLISKFSTGPDHFEEYRASAFQNLDFTEKCFNGISNMSKPYRQIAPVIVEHLGALSDEGKRIFTGPWQQAKAEFGGVGVEVTDENGKTKSNATAAKERLINLNGKDYYFWWHTKLEADRDRIHFCPDLVPAGGLIIVGIFCEHLTV